MDMMTGDELHEIRVKIHRQCAPLLCVYLLCVVVEPLKANWSDVNKLYSGSECVGDGYLQSEQHTSYH